ncbi:MAG: SpoVA/SpoVAEb family sporulation membrane protein [Lachnospiraceae bacterium]
MNEENALKQKKLYADYVKQKTPKSSWLLNIINAFWVGGLICLLGQIATNIWKWAGISEENSKLCTVIFLVLLSVVLTSLGWYAKIAKLGGAGTVVPITGFANSVASAAIEYKKEGQVFGIGCQIFSIAGPVILYGIFSTWVMGLIYWFGKLLGWF